MSTNAAIRVYHYGGPEQLKWEQVPLPQPAEKEVLIRHEAVGLNYIDVYYRTGLYANPLPLTPGIEGAGIVEAVGPGVEFFAVGDRVAYAKGPLGAYALYRTIAEENLVKVPEGISNEYAAASLLKGLTAHYLLRRTFDVRPGFTILVHAAAGGMGLILCQWGKALGGRVIGATSSPEKAALAKVAGADEVLLYSEDWVAKLRELTGGKGCNVVYDSVGKDTFLKSLDCLTPFGLMVSYGQSSGLVEPFDISLLVKKGSLFLTRPSLNDYKRDRKEYILGAGEFFDLMLKGIVKITIGQSFYLSDAASAHRELESRRTTGSTILIPG